MVFSNILGIKRLDYTANINAGSDVATAVMAVLLHLHSEVQAK